MIGILIILAIAAAAIAFLVAAIILGVSFFGNRLIFAPYKRPPLTGGYQLWGETTTLTPEQLAKAKALAAELN